MATNWQTAVLVDGTAQIRCVACGELTPLWGASDHTVTVNLGWGVAPNPRFGKRDPVSGFLDDRTTVRFPRKRRGMACPSCWEAHS